MPYCRYIAWVLWEVFHSACRMMLWWHFVGKLQFCASLVARNSALRTSVPPALLASLNIHVSAVWQRATCLLPEKCELSVPGDHCNSPFTGT